MIKRDNQPEMQRLESAARLVSGPNLKTIADCLSWSRLFVALVVTIFYSPQIKLRFIFTASLLLYAEISDHLDGILARRSGFGGQRGYVIDSLNDRAIYVAFILVLVYLREVSLTLAWILIFRDIAVYAARSLQATWLESNKIVRPLHLCHATFIRLWFLSVLVRHGSKLFFDLELGHIEGWLLIEKSFAMLAALFGYVALWLVFGRVLRVSGSPSNRGNDYK